MHSSCARPGTVPSTAAMTDCHLKAREHVVCITGCEFLPLGTFQVNKRVQKYGL